MKELLTQLTNYFISVDDTARIAILVFAFFVIIGLIEFVFMVLKFIYKHIILRFTTLAYDIYFFLRHYNKK